MRQNNLIRRARPMVLGCVLALGTAAGALMAAPALAHAQPDVQPVSSTVHSVSAPVPFGPGAHPANIKSGRLVNHAVHPNIRSTTNSGCTWQWILYTWRDDSYREVQLTLWGTFDSSWNSCGAYKTQGYEYAWSNSAPAGVLIASVNSCGVGSRVHRWIGGGAVSSGNLWTSPIYNWPLSAYGSVEYISNDGREDLYKQSLPPFC